MTNSTEIKGRANKMGADPYEGNSVVSSLPVKHRPHRAMPVLRPVAVFVRGA